MAGRYPGLARALISNQAGGRAVAIQTAIGPRCVTAEMVPNVLSQGRPVPQLRFICDAYCSSAGLVAKRASKACRPITNQMLSNTPIAIPAGAQVLNVTVPTPYRSGGGGGTISGVPGVPALTF